MPVQRVQMHVPGQAAPPLCNIGSKKKPFSRLYMLHAPARVDRVLHAHLFSEAESSQASESSVCAVPRKLTLCILLCYPRELRRRLTLLSVWPRPGRRIPLGTNPISPGSTSLDPQQQCITDLHVLREPSSQNAA